MFSSLQGMREETIFRMNVEKVRASKRKVEIDDPKLPKKEKFGVIMRKKKLLKKLHLQLRSTTAKE